MTDSSSNAIKFTWRAGFVSLITLVIVFVGWTTAFAHDPGLSVAEIKVTGSQTIAAEISFASADIDAALRIDQDGDGSVSPDEVDKARDGLAVFAASVLEVTAGRQVVAASRIESSSDDAGGVILRIDFDGHAGSEIEIRSAIFNRLARGHRQYVRVSDQTGGTLAEKLLDSTDNVVRVTTDGTKTASIAGVSGKFLVLGVEHILTGYDHLVFLFALLLVCASFKESAKIITSFTVAHSITLALAALDVVSIPSAVVEPLIAGSIAYVGIENLRRNRMSWRWLLTFGFGLAHGFGFASVLSDLGVGSGSHATVALFSFNAGVELGQIGIAAIVLPILWLIRMRPVYSARLVPVCSVLIALAGAFWMVERLKG